MTISAGLNSISVSREVPLDDDGTFIEDIIGMRVYVSETSPVVANTTNLKYSGASLSATISGLKGGTTYYVGTALVSSLLGNEFTDDELLLVYEGSIATLKAPGSVSVQLSAPSVTLQADASGTVSDYSTSGTTLKVFDGVTPIAYDGVGTSNNTWKVVLSASNITAGSVSDSGDYATVGSHSNMTSDSASVTYTVSGVTSLGSSFSQTITQYLTKSRKGTRGWTIARIDAWTDSAANAAIAAVATTNNASPTTPIKGDTVFYTGGAKQYDGSSWASAGQFIDGNLIVNGTVIGTHLAAQFSIRSGGKIIAGDETNGVVLNSDKTIKVLSDGGVKAILGEIDGSYGFRAYSPAGTLLFDSLADTAFLADVDKNNYLVGDSTTFPTFSDTSSGGYNLALGSGTLTGAASPTRKFNVAVGTEALHFASGSSNTAVGTASQFGGYSEEHTGDFNTSVGCDSLRSLSYGSGNTAIGGSANKSLSSITNTTSIGTNSSANNWSTAVGWGAGSMTALDSVSIGSEAGNSSQNYSISVGRYSNAGQESVTAGYRAGNPGSSYSVAIGGYSGYNSTSANSVFIGRSAGYSHTGHNSVAVGYSSATSAESNIVAIGYQAGQTARYGSVTVGSSTQSLYYGVAVGFAANSAGSGGIAIGDSSKSANDAVVIGRYAGATSNSAGATIVGAYAGGKVTGPGNAFFGYQSGKEMVSGSSNSFFGWLSGANATGYSNSFFGQGAGENSGAGNNNVHIGTHAGGVASGNQNTLVGTGSGYSHTGNYSVVIGTNAGYNSTSDFITVVGRSAGQTAGANSSIVGHASNAGTNSVTVGANSWSTSTSSVSIGVETTCSSDNSITIGYQAGKTAGTNPLVSIGYQSGLVSTGLGNTFIGNYAGSATTSGLNTFVGYKAGTLSNALGNSLFGFKVGEAITTGGNNCLFGSVCGDLLQTGEGNSFFGRGAGHSVVTGSNNVFIGNSSGSACASDVSNAVILGNSTTASSGEIVLSDGGGTVRGKCSSSGSWEFTSSVLSQSKVGSSSGGAVTQATSRTTGVTLNKPSGEISLFSTTASANQITTFTLTNSFIGANDVVKICQKSGTGLYFCHVTNVAAGSCKISVHTVSAVTTAEAPKLSFVVISGAIA